MANGPFGNPLSTGIALSGVIDIVTPVRQAEERKRQREAAEKKERDQRAKELGAIMGKIAIDEDKIWWRYHDDARLQYADTIDKVQQMYSAGDYAGMYKTINQFDTKMANYIQATNQKNKWEDSVRKGDKYYDQTYLNALENRDVDMPDLVKIADESGFGAYDPNTNILGFIDPVQRIDLREKVKKAIDGQKYMYEKQGKSLKVSGYGASGEPVYEMSLQDRQGTIDAVKKSIQPQAVPYMLMEMGYSKEDQLKMTPQELDQRLNEAIENTYNLYATKEERGPIPRETQPKTGADFIGGIGMKQTGAGETVSMQTPNYEALRKDSSPLVSGIISKVVDEDKLKSLNKNLATSGVQFENVTDSPLDDKNYVSINYGGESKEFVIGDEASVKGAVDWLINQGVSDAQLEEFTKEMGVDVPKSSQSLLNFTDQIRIQSTGKTDIRKKFTLPAGDIIAKGTGGAKMVNIKNKIPVSGASIDNIGVDESGKLWATISYPVKEDDDVLTKLFGSDNDIESFKKSAGSLPTTFIVPYDEDIKSTVLSLDKNMTEALLEQKLSALKGTSGTSSTGANTPSFQ